MLLSPVPKADRDSRLSMIDWLWNSRKIQYDYHHLSLESACKGMFTFHYYNQTSMSLFVLHPATSIDSFIQFWTKFYTYDTEEIYDRVVEAATLKSEDIKSLYQWKNNMGKDKKAMSETKVKFVQHIQDKLDVVNELKSNFDLQRYKAEFGNLKPVWGLLLLHVLQPSQYPIYDQHVLRAFRFIVNATDLAPTKDREHYKVYYEKYTPFFNELHQKCSHPRKRLDDALWAYGRFLKQYRGAGKLETLIENL